MDYVSMEQVFGATNDDTVIEIYREGELLTAGKWYQGNILDYTDAPLRGGAFMLEKNICLLFLETQEEEGAGEG